MELIAITSIKHQHQKGTQTIHRTSNKFATTDEFKFRNAAAHSFERNSKAQCNKMVK